MTSPLPQSHSVNLIRHRGTAASFLITVERLPARPAALAICTDTIFPVWQPVRVSPFDNQRTTRKSEIRLPRLIRTLSERSPSSQGRTGNWAGTVKRTVTPDRFRTGHPCLAAINSLGPLAPGLSALVKPAKQSARVFNVLFRPPFCFLLLHAVEVSERRRGWKAKVFPNLTKVLSVSK